MKTLLITLATMVILFSNNVFSHANHSHINEQQAIEITVKSAKKNDL